MSGTLHDRVALSLAAQVREGVAAFAKALAREAGADAVLFYGSNLRTGSLDGVLDFYLLLPGRQQERIWPRVGYHEREIEGMVLRAKTATLSLEQFAKAAAGRSRDTTIWARFVQPSALVWARDDGVRRKVVEAVASAAVTAGALAAALGPARGPANTYWRALFRETYAAEFRVEPPGREDSILAANEAHFHGLLPLAWEAAGIAFERSGDELVSYVEAGERRRILRWWTTRRRLGKPLNILRLAKATTTFDNAAAYGAWKLERHTGIALEVTPFRARHPLLAMPGAAYELWRARRKKRTG
ncbi:hypothetical protein [Erythrobacter sp. A6_0]|uniref:hypothetical protein n=1 Tax=Erythrobacter sp. A6_0 TaxID=2821089 RepID=UPI001ADA1249|nr:hypothetical protein [Erythrobacter sp. A6_0]